MSLNLINVPFFNFRILKKKKTRNKGRKHSKKRSRFISLFYTRLRPLSAYKIPTRQYPPIKRNPCCSCYRSSKRTKSSWTRESVWRIQEKDRIRLYGIEKVVSHLIGYSIRPSQKKTQPTRETLVPPWSLSRSFFEILSGNNYFGWKEVSDFHPIPEEKSIDLISASFTGRIPSQRLR